MAKSLVSCFLTHGVVAAATAARFFIERTDKRIHVVHKRYTFSLLCNERKVTGRAWGVGVA